MIIDQAGRARGSTRYLAPPPELRAVVVEAWSQRYSARLLRECRGWRVVPDLQPHLIVHATLGGQPLGPRVVGARSVYLDVPVGGRAWSAGVTLRPGVLPALTHCAAADFLDRSAGAEAVWGPSGRRLAEAVRGEDSPEGVLRILLAFLADRAGRVSRAVDWRVEGFRTLAAGTRAPRVSDIAASMGVSPRTLRQVWGREVGLPPSRAVAIQRLHRAVKRALGHPGAAWSAVAQTTGYYDQAHLIRDFRRFLGETPGSFLARGRPDGS